MTAKTAVQIYALKDPWAEDREKTLTRIAELGIAGVEGFSLGDTMVPRAERIAAAALLRRQVADAGLELTGAHTLLPTLDDPDWIFEEMDALGTPVALASTTERVLGFSRDALADRDRIPRFADRLNGLSVIAARHGMRIGYHNHWWEWVDVDGRPAYDRLVELLDPTIVLEVDLFWAYSAGQDVAELVAAYADRVEFLHVKDGDGVAGNPQVAAGTGDVPLEAAIRAASNATYNILEVDTAGDADIWQVVGDGARWLQNLTVAQV